MEYDDVLERYHVTIWKHGNQYPAMAWSERIKFIWRLLTTGKPYGDEVILSQREANRLGSFVQR
jgi:hypothetical protein